MMGEEFLFTDKGWPRPLVHTWPIPWVSPIEDLKRVDPTRMKEVVEYALCEVCGECPEDEEWVYLLVNLENGPIPSNLSEKVIQAMDNACMHERCYKLAVGRCPALRNMKKKCNLIVYRAQHKNLRIYTEDDGTQILGVDGTHATQVQIASVVHG